MLCDLSGSIPVSAIGSAGRADAGSDIITGAWYRAAPMHCHASPALEPLLAGYTLYHTTLLTDRFLALSSTLVSCLVCFPPEHPLITLIALHLPLWWCGPQLLQMFFHFQPTVYTGVSLQSDL